MAEHVGEDENLDTDKAARFLSVSPQTLKNWRVDGSGPPYIKLSPGPRGSVRYRKRDLLDFVQSRLVTSTSEAA